MQTCCYFFKPHYQIIQLFGKFLHDFRTEWRKFGMMSKGVSDDGMQRDTISAFEMKSCRFFRYPISKP